MIKKIILKLFPFLRSKSSVEKYIENGNLIFGKNSEIKGLSIFIQDPISKKVNIRIGDNCMLSGSILIYNNNAEIIIGNGVFIGTESKLFCYSGIEIGDDTMLSWGVTLIDTNAHSVHSEDRKKDVSDWKKGPSNKDWSKVKHAKIKVEEKSWIGFNSIITKGVLLKEGTIIGCGSVVTESTEPFGVYAGNPAILKKISD